MINALTCVIILSVLFLDMSPSLTQTTNKQDQCPGTQQYKTCGSPCNRTCSEPEPLCIQYCVERCECPHHTVQDAGQCITVLHCELLDDERLWLKALVPDGSTFPVSLQVRVSSAPASFAFCCDMRHYGEQAFYLEPVGNPILDTFLVRSEVNLHFSLTLNDPEENSAMYFKDKFYSVLAIDPDIPVDRSTVGTNDRPLAHMLLTNGLVMDTSDGLLTLQDYPLPYLGPSPPAGTPHTYYFLVMEHTKRVSISSEDLLVKNITEACTSRLKGRCLFNIPLFTQTYNLTTVAISWFRAENDDYVNFRNGLTSSCEGRAGFADPCPMGSSSSGAIHIYSIPLVLALTYGQLHLNIIL